MQYPGQHRLCDCGAGRTSCFKRCGSSLEPIDSPGPSMIISAELYLRRPGRDRPTPASYVMLIFSTATSYPGDFVTECQPGTVLAGPEASCSVRRVIHVRARLGEPDPMQVSTAWFLVMAKGLHHAIHLVTSATAGSGLLLGPSARPYGKRDSDRDKR